MALSMSLRAATRPLHLHVPRFLISHSILQSPIAAALLDWRSPLQDWLREGILWAVPKKKVSHSRKRMRSAHKGLEPEQGIVRCPACGKPKRSHHLCLSCYADILLEQKSGRSVIDEEMPAGLVLRKPRGGITP